MPIEMGLALYPALLSQRHEHRCTFFVHAPHDYQRFASDLAGLDPHCHNGTDTVALALMYDWLRGVVPQQIFNDQPTVSVGDKFREYRARLVEVNGSGPSGVPTHLESREVMYIVCADAQWWDWRATKAGRAEFPQIPLSWRRNPPPAAIE